MESYLAYEGFEVWRVDLRGQGGSVSVGGGENYRMEDLALTDLGAAIDAALLYSRTGADRADVLGCSLGGTLMFVQAVLNEKHRMGSLVAMGAPLRWEIVNPIVRALFAWPMLVGAVRIKGTRRLAEFALPHLVKNVPWLLSLYLNPSITDTVAVQQFVKTVEDPNRHINRQIAHWIKDRDLILEGVNISQAFGKVTSPFMCILGNADGIVPRETAEFAYKKAGSPVKKLIRVGDRELKVAHADLFISKESQAKVFAPITEWLVQRNS
ncbi:alpha/beta fold hydrolase [Bdellovibrionota bacterium FG-2]